MLIELMCIVQTGTTTILFFVVITVIAIDQELILGHSSKFIFS